MYVSDTWNRLNKIVEEYLHLNRVEGLLSWDQQTYMPKGGLEARAESASTISRLAHETLATDEVGELLAALEEDVANAPYESDEASIVRLTRRTYDRAVKLPSSLVTELSKAITLAQNAWEEAREKDDFEHFEPHLKHVVDLQIEKATALGFESELYDGLLDIFEPEMKSAEVTRIFDRLKEELIPLVQAINERTDLVDDSILDQEYDEDRQWQMTMDVIKTLGFDLTRGRQDRSAHPFTVGIAPTDVRLTTRIDPRNFAGALYSSIHEAGHGLYEQGLPTKHLSNLIGTAISLGVHESQSRLWENIIGRSRGFWEYLLPRAQELFPSQLAKADVETVYRAVNKVRYPSPIRVEADEVTYNLHIFLRFDLERALICGDLAVKDLPDAWNEKTKEFLGFTPKNDRQGVLQDVHWSAGLFGYFPTYSLGTILSVQLYNEAIAEHPDIPEATRKGEFEALGAWMKEQIYQHGSRFTPVELIERATGGPLDPEPYLTYIKEKFGELYGLT